MDKTEILDPTIPLCTEPALIGLFYGSGGRGKSTLCAQATRYWKKKGYRSRVIGTDNGSFDPYEKGIKEGYIDYMSADAWTSLAPNVLFKLLAEGWWPEDVKTPNSKLLPGFEELRLCMFCGADSGSRGATMLPACAACKKPFPAGTRLPLTRRLTSLKGIGLVIFEGISKAGDMFLSACRESRPGDKFYVAASHDGQALALKANELLKKENRTAADEQILAAARNACEVGELSLAKGAGQDHYLKAQLDVRATIAACKRLPIPHVLWTALEGREEVPLDPKRPDAGMKLLGLGPLGPGKGLTRTMTPWFSMVGHVVEKIKTEAAAGGGSKTTSSRTLHLAAHPGEGTISWEGKTNVVGMVKSIPLEDPEKINNFSILMDEVAKAKEKELP